LISPEDCEVLRLLEEQLWRPSTRYSLEFMEAILAEEFVEVGASGVLYDRRAIIEAAPRSIVVEFPLPEFSVREVAPGVALVTYRSVQANDDGSERCARRTSLWVRVGEDWRLVFHQGTLQD
jgi:ribonuclease HI